MPRKVDRPLSATRVATAAKPGLYADGDGLYLQVTPAGGKSWLFRYMRHGRARKMGLGPLRDVSLAAARVKARAYRVTLRDNGKDPLAERNRARMELRLAEAKAVTFSDCCAGYIAAYGTSWRNPKHREQWRTTLATYVEPTLGKLPVQDIDTGLVIRVLEPIWQSKTETATRIRQRVEAVLDWARVREYRVGENPARWKGHLDKLLPKAGKLKRTQHFAALPYTQIGGFIADLRNQVGVAARALEFAILTAARTNEVTHARWEEFDGTLWTVPAERMKAARQHIVPLSARASAILKELRRLDSEWVFPGLKQNKPISNMAMLTLLKRMKRTDITVHGFRSTFRDWAAEQTNYPREVAEQALAHALEDRTEGAYRRSDLLEKRRRLMVEWARYTNKPTVKATVTQIRGRA